MLLTDIKPSRRLCTLQGTPEEKRVVVTICCTLTLNIGFSHYCAGDIVKMLPTPNNPFIKQKLNKKRTALTNEQ
jgi:hypothetical protein